MSVPARLRSGALRPLWTAAYERLSSGRPVSRIRIGPLEEAEREAVADLLGMDRLPGAYVGISMTTLDAALREATGLDTSDVVTTLIGPLDDRAAKRAHGKAERAALWDWLTTHEVIAAQPTLHEWVAQVRRAGTINGSVPETRRVLDQVLTALGRLPADGVPLPAFADVALGDPHALDDGKRTTALVLRAVATLFDVPPPTNAEERRALWERAGVAADELSTTVLAAGLRATGAGPVSQILNLCADAGQAAVLTLAQLRASKDTPAAQHVWVVENPTVLALALRRFGTQCPPLVCTSGWPNGACTLLLRRLTENGTLLHYHGDVDGEGIRIAAYVTAKTGARPWRMSTADYLDGLSYGTTGPSVGRVTDAPWDDELAPAMRHRQIAVPEERVAESLLTAINNEQARNSRPVATGTDTSPAGTTYSDRQAPDRSTMSARDRESEGFSGGEPTQPGDENGPD